MEEKKRKGKQKKSIVVDVCTLEIVTCYAMEYYSCFPAGNESSFAEIYPESKDNATECARTTNE